MKTTFTFSGQTVNRLGYGAMRITGAGIWGYPRDREECLRVLRRTAELGIDFIDTANSYGPYVSEELIAEALHPYENTTVATKAGLVRTGPDGWAPCGRPDYLRQECEMSLRRLKTDALDLFQLHRIDPATNADEQFGVLRALLDEGKVKAVGLSEVSVDEIKAAQRVVPIATVQNLYNVTNRKSEAVLEYCEEEDIGFIPWFPVASGALTKSGGPLDELATGLGATISQLSLSWLLHRSPVMMPIPGTSQVSHLEENWKAWDVTLDAEAMKTINALAS